MNPPRKIKVLLVEDRVEDAEILLREMRMRGLAIVSQRVDTGADFEEALTAFAPDLILSDYSLPGFDGTEALRIAQMHRPDTPFMFVSGTIGEERAIQALRQGAVDYVLKENRARLVPAIERALREAEDRDARRWAQRELEESEERFRFAMQFSSVGVALVAPNGRWLSINPALCDIVGYSESELLATDVQSITYPDDRDADAAQVRQMLERAIEPIKPTSATSAKMGASCGRSSAAPWFGCRPVSRIISSIRFKTSRTAYGRSRRCAPAKRGFGPLRRPPRNGSGKSMQTVCTPFAVRRRRQFSELRLIG